jgi:hypothetical protein
VLTLRFHSSSERHQKSHESAFAKAAIFNCLQFSKGCTTAKIIRKRIQKATSLWSQSSERNFKCMFKILQGSLESFQELLTRPSHMLHHIITRGIAWLTSTAGVVPSRVVPGVATTSWKQLDCQQADDILWLSWHRVAWNVTMKNTSPPLHIAKVFKATTEGEGKIQIYELPVF